ncbi:MAG TPA: outer membrane beta-barrel protein [Spirochaetota bacterium]|nr:outer membrane beta-barrel protein [Spirochaetota bacterium]HOM38435.1 outer membrane beta-barrel protein [Spirochaetota bacterium]HPQ48974.1 outer membrane beta-barrel protein [Spirochaetota bacterium]
MKKLIVLFLLIFSVSLFAQEEGNSKSDWYIGFGIGGGDAKFDDGSKFSNVTTPISIWFGVGAIINDSIHFGLDISAVAAINEENDPIFGKIKEHYQLNRYYAALTYFPFYEGLFFRAGAGLSVYLAKLEVSGIEFSDSTNGFGGLIGIGYCFNISDSFNIGINFDFDYSSFSEGDIKSYQIYISFNWF